jgi:CheY-like chemotaxis protein
MEALETLDALDGRIDLVISDNMMPGMTGRELVEHIHGQWPRLRLLVCSGFNPTHESEVTELDYVSSYVQKPYQRKELLRKVRAALDEER